MLIVDEEHAAKRNANIFAYITGYAASPDGFDMVSPSGSGAVSRMSNALKESNRKIDYINAHGTNSSWYISELNAIGSLKMTSISSTKSMTGHSLGAAGSQEAIYSILMMHNNFVAPSINISNLVDEASNLNIVAETTDKNHISDEQFYLDLWIQCKPCFQTRPKKEYHPH